VVIRNGRVLDGEGNPWVHADIAINNGRFAKIGRVEARGLREIDAKGDYVSPGWIDMMDQSGEVLLKNGLAENKLREGVTTAIAGEGGTPVPSSQIDAYFKQLEAQGISLNFGTYYSSAQARVESMGEAAGRPSAEQLDAMRAHVDEAMRAGAMGIATALIYPPDSFQSTEDLVELARVAAIRLHPFTWLARHQRRDDDAAAHAIRCDLSLQRVATRTGFVKDLHGPGRLALKLPNQAPHRRRLVGQLPRHGHCGRATQHRDEENLLVRIDPDERSNLFHDRLLSMRLWRRQALTRDIGGHRPPCRVQQHYDATIAGRSFHIV
jgi:N-acyl-D-aspartate/D-glutamate deacylase